METVKFFAYHRNLAQELVRSIVSCQPPDSPNFSKIAIVFPSELLSVPHPQTYITDLLLKSLSLDSQNNKFVAPPFFDMPGLFHLFSDAPEESVMNDRFLNYLLAEQLAKNPAFAMCVNPCKTADRLIQVFQKMTDYSLAKTHRKNFNLKLSSIQETAHDDAKLLFRLWEAWRKFTSVPYADSKTLFLQWLCSSNLGLLPDLQHSFHHFYFCGFLRFGHCQRIWLDKLLTAGRATLIAHCSPIKAITAAFPHPLQDFANRSAHPPPTNPHTTENQAFPNSLSTIFGEQPVDIPTTSMTERSQQLHQQFPTSPLYNKISIFCPKNAAIQCQGVLMTIQRWLRSGKKNIAVISPNHNFIRRMRPIFAKARLPLDDYVGQQLSAASCAGTLRLLLNYHDQDSFLSSLLGILRSPYCTFSIETPDVFAMINLVQTLSCNSRCSKEQQILLQLAQSPDCRAQKTAALVKFIGKLPLFTIPQKQTNNEKTPFSVCFDALSHTMASLKMTEGFSQEAKGCELLKILKEHEKIAAQNNISGTYTAWKNWLMAYMEEYIFISPHSHHTSGLVTVLTPAQLGIQKYDAIAAVDLDVKIWTGREELDTVIPPESLEALKVEDKFSARIDQYYRFRILLGSSCTFLLSYIGSQNSLDDAPLPWLTVLEYCHKRAYKRSLINETLESEAKAVLSPYTEITQKKNNLHKKIYARPQPKVPKKWKLRRLSARSYQRLVNCPYQFYCRDILELSVNRPQQETWSAADFGKAVHHALYLLHQKEFGGVNIPPLPWQTQHRNLLVKTTGQIVDKIFADIEHRPHMDYLIWEMKELVEDYIDWAIAFGSRRVIKNAKSEQFLSKDINPSLRLVGRVDLVTKMEEDKTRILDFQTTEISISSVNNGEQTQLGAYALLASDVAEVGYLNLTPKRRKLVSLVSGKTLQELKQNHLRRIEYLQDSLNKPDISLPAHGHPHVCKSCDYSSICRHYEWQ